jgi:oligopeptide transport system substrate-binding protein
LYDKRFANAKLRQAVSLAINRQEINDKIFFGTRPPATSWSNPLAPGGGASDCTVCPFNPDEAKQLLQEAGGFQGEMVFYYNGDASHKEWMDAVAQSVKNVLRINARAEGLPTFAVFRQQVNDHKMKGPYRAAWQEDYPDVENWLGPLYVTGGSSNDGLYSNPEVDRLYKEGTSAATVDAAHAKFADATKIIDHGRPVDADQQLQRAVRLLAEAEDGEAGLAGSDRDLEHRESRGPRRWDGLGRRSRPR